MKVTEVVVLPVRGRHWPRFPMVFVEVHTDAGLVGTGEALHYQTSGLIESAYGRRAADWQGPVSDRAPLGDALSPGYQSGRD
jgi:L-alanine-DL-glutamate epimerase-like enolase superfamily enzyme